MKYSFLKRIYKTALPTFLVFNMLLQNVAFLITVKAQETESTHEVTEGVVLPTEELTPTSAEVEVGSTPATIQEVVLPTEEMTPVPTQKVVVESTPEVIFPREVMTKGTWGYDLTTKVASTNYTIEEGYTYVAPQNSAVTVTFTYIKQIEGNEPKLTIKEVTLTDTQVKELNAVSNTAYDISVSSLNNGDFKYNLTLPSTNSNAELVYSEDGMNFEEVNGEVVNADSVEVTGLDHFTIFIVVNPNPVGNGNPSADLCTTVGVAGDPICYDTIQAAINAASNGDTIMIAAGTFNPTSTINVNKSLTITGSGVDVTVVDASGMPGSSYGMNVTASNVSFSDFTFQNGPHYGFKTSNVNNISLTNIKVSGFGRSNIDFNGVDYITLTNVQAYNTPYGVGIALTDSNFATLTNITTSGNAWSGIALYTSHYYAPPGVSNVVLTGSNSFSEVPGLYSEVYSAGDIIDGNTLTPTFKYAVVDIAAPNYVTYYTSSQLDLISIGAGVTVTDITTDEVVYPDTTAPSVPVLTWPIDGEVTNDNTPLLQWEDSTDLFDVVSYDYQSRYNCTDVNDVNTCATTYNTTVSNSQRQAGTIADKTYFWRVRATDEYGNTSAYSDYEQFTVDTVDPAKVTLLSPADGSFVNGSSLTTSWNAITDADHYMYESYHDAGLTNLRWSQTVNGTSKTATNVADSTFWWRVRAVDAAGNLGEWSDAWAVNIDNVAPVTTITNPIDLTSVSGIVDLRGTITEPNLLRYYYAISPAGISATVYSGEFVDQSIYSWDTTLVSDGTYTIRLEARDKAMNKDADSTDVITVYVDNTAPVIDTPSDITAEGTVTSGSTVDVTITPPMSHDATDGDLPAVCDYSTGHFDYGDTLVTCTKTDSLGNTATPVSFTVTVQDTTSPVGTISVNNAILSDSTRTEIVTINYSEPMNTSTSPTISFVGAVGTWSIKTAGVWNSTTEYQITYKVSDANEESTNITVTSTGAQDLAGLNESTTAVTFDIDTKNPIVSWTTPAISGTHVKSTVTLETSATDVMSGINYVRFRVKPQGDPNSSYVTLINDYSSPYSYGWDTTILPDGEYTLRARANDGVGNKTLIHTDVTVDNTAPIITVPTDFTVEATKPEGADVTYTAPTALDAIDGITVVTCDYNSGDTFVIGTTTVTCESTDDAGNTATETFDITVEDTTAPSVPANLHFSNTASTYMTCGSYTNIQNITVDWDDSTDAVGVSGYDYNIDYPLIGGGRGNWTTSKTTSIHSGSLNPGLHQIKVRAKDEAGNLSDWTNLCDITYDNQAPTIDTIDNQTFNEGDLVNLGDTGLDLANKGMWDETLLDKAYVSVSYKDLNGDDQTSTVLSEINSLLGTSIGIDNIIDISTVNGDGKGGTISDLFTYYGYPSEILNEDIPIDTSIIPEGTYTVDYHVTDMAGNESTYQSVTITINNVAPTATLNSDQTISAITEGGVATFTGSFTDPSYIDDAVYPTATPLSATTQNIFADADDSAWSASVDYGEGNGFENLDSYIVPGDITVPNHIYTNEGTYTVTLKICEDDDTNGFAIPEIFSEPTLDPWAGEGECNTATTTVTVINLAPTVTITESAGPTVYAGTAVTLTANPISGNPGYTYLWSGECSGNAQTAVAPSTIGAHTCNVLVTDVDGDTATASSTITVIAVPTTVTNQSTEVIPTPTTTPEEDENLEGEVLGLSCSEEEQRLISGYIYNDKNENGVQDTDENGIEGIKVIIKALVDGNYEVAKEITTDKNGYYEALVCLGEYKVVIDQDSLSDDLKVLGDTDQKIEIDDTDKQVNFNILDESGFNWWIIIIPSLILLSLFGLLSKKKR